MARPSVTLSLLMVLALVLGISAASAAPVSFIGFDAGASSGDPRPNSNAAAASFDAAASGLGGVQIFTFESAPLGSFSSLPIASGVSLTGTDVTSANQTVRNTPFGTPENVFGYNTTGGGTQFASAFGGSFTVSFTSPTTAFGFYLTGLQLPGETVTFNDGSPQSVAIPNPGSGVAFIGFIDDQPFSSLTINALNDIVGIDDVRTLSGSAVPPTPVPEPTSLLLLGSVAAGGAVARWRQRSRDRLSSSRALLYNR